MMAQIEQMETTISKMTNTLGKINSRIDIAKENISVLEYLTIKTFQDETHKRAKIQNQMKRVSVSYGTISNGLRYM